MSSRVSPTEKIRAEIDALFGSGRDLAEVLEDVARLGARLIMQSAVEAEVDEFLGRARYQRRAEVPDARPGSRNGYCPTTVKTTAGPVTLDRPKLRGTDEKFVSRLFGTAVSKTNALETLVIAGFVRGLSVRDVEAALADALGAQAALSKSTVSRVCQAIRDEFDTWRARRLDDVELDYLFLDGSHFKMHQGSRAEPVLAAWGITTAGKPVLVGLDAASNEGNDAWDGFLDGLTERGLRPPLLVISDGAAGLVGAIERSMPRSLRQRCLIHRSRNLLAKVPAHAQGEVKAAYWAMFDIPADTPPQKAEALAQQRIQTFAASYHKAFPAAVRCLLDDQQALTAYLRFPREHWSRTRHSNFIERTFGETRRRVKVIGRLPSETSCTSLVWAVLDRASRGWRGFTVTAGGTRLLQDLRRQLLDPPTIRVGVRWQTGAADELTLARPGPGRTPDEALELIRRHGATHTSAQLADMLNAAGRTTGKGKPFTPGGVARVRDAYKIFGPRTVAVRDGEVSVKHAAEQLGIPADAVCNWLRLGQLPARRGPSGRWCIPWDPATQEIYRQKVADSLRLKPVPPAQRTGSRAQQTVVRQD